jgi:hypothetical protein
MKNDFSNFGIRVESLEFQIKSVIDRVGKKAIHDTDIAVTQQLESISVILNEISAEMAVLMNEVKKILNPEIDNLNEQINQSNISGLQQITAKQEDESNRKIGSTEVDIKRMKITYDWSKIVWLRLAILALCTIDSALNYSSFQVIAHNLLVSIVISIAVAIGLALAAHLIGSKMQMAESKKIKQLWFGGGLLGAGVVFLMLGFLRKTYVGGASTFSNSPILWMLLNLFFFTVALLLAYMKLPTKEQALELKNMDDKKKLLESLKRDKEIILAELAGEERRINDCRQRIESFRKYRDELLNALESEKERLHTMCIKEFTLKSGNASINSLKSQNLN